MAFFAKGFSGDASPPSSRRPAPRSREPTHVFRCDQCHRRNVMLWHHDRTSVWSILPLSWIALLRGRVCWPCIQMADSAIW